MVRQFKLINALGQEFDLMRKDAFFLNPSGLGHSTDFDTEPVGYDFLEIYSEDEQKTISGEMVFEGYAQYQEFVKFCAQTPIQFAYRPLQKWYYIDCKLQAIQKTEIKPENNRLICPVDFLCFSTWYESAIAIKTELQPNIGKVFNYTYPYTYAETAAGSARIENNGTLPAFCKIHIMGPCEAPSWSLTQSGKVIVRGQVNATIPTGNKLVVNSSPLSLEIAEYTVDNIFVDNLYQDSDFSTGRFVILPPGESILSFAHDGPGAIDAFVEVHLLAQSV